MASIRRHQKLLRSEPPKLPFSSQWESSPGGFWTLAKKINSPQPCFCGTDFDLLYDLKAKATQLDSVLVFEATQSVSLELHFTCSLCH